MQLTPKLLHRVQDVRPPRAGILKFAASRTVLPMPCLANVVLVLRMLQLLRGAGRRHWIANLHIHYVQHAVDVAFLARFDDRVLESPIACSQEDLGLLT